MTPPTSLRDRIRLRLRSRSAIEAERDDAVANAQGWKRSAESWRDEFDQVGRVLCEHGYHAHEGWGVLASDVRQALAAHRAHASHWRREVAKLVGVQAEGTADSDLLRRLQQIIADGTRAQEVADRARDDEEAAYEGIRRVANALRAGCKGFRVDDVVAWAEEAASPDSLLASREKLLQQAETFEAELTAVDEVLAKAGARPADDRVEFLRVLAGQHRRGVTVAEQVPEVVRERDLHRLAAEEAGNELDAIRDELRACHHRVGDPRGLSYDVDIAIDVERERGQDFVERLAEVLGWGSRSSWPHAAPHIVRAVAVRLGKPMPRRRPHPAAWPVGSRMSRALACTCRGVRAFGPSSVVDPRCPEHSPGRRFGRSARPLELPPGDRDWCDGTCCRDRFCQPPVRAPWRSGDPTRAAEVFF